MTTVTAEGQHGRLAGAGAAGAAALGCGIALLATSGWLISRAAQHPPVLDLAVAVTAVRAFGLGRGALRYLERLVAHDATFRILARLRARVYDALVRVGPAGLPAFRRGDLLARFVADVDAVQDRYLRVFLPAGVAVATGAASTVVAALLLPVAGAVLGVSLLVGGVVVPWLSAALARRAEAAAADDRGTLTAAVAELLTYAPELAVVGALDERLRAAGALDRRLTRSARRSALATGLGAGLLALASGAAVLGALVAGAAAVRNGQLSGVLLATVVLLPLAASEAIGGLPAAAQSLSRVRRSTARVGEVLSAPGAAGRPARPLPAPSSPFPLVFNGVVARWPGAASPALTGIDLRLEAGQRVAVVGASGAGKSTLAAVLVRFLDPSAGRFTLAGTDARALDPDAVRRHVGWCAQDAHLFDTTIRDNLLIARPDADEDELWSALRQARLADWVGTLPRGLDTPVGERGKEVSGGQRQRLALARVLLADFPIVVLDEPGANLDPATADALTADLLTATAGRATLLITHRLMGCETADEVLVLGGGAVVQRGTHVALMTADEDYRRWWDRERAADAVAGLVSLVPVG